MSIRNILAITMVAFLAPMFFASTASAQFGQACGTGGLAPTACGLGGQIRGQIGDGLPLPISFAAAQGGSGTNAIRVLADAPFTAITITNMAPPGGLPYVGQGLGQPGQIKPTASATIMQTTNPGAGPRQLTLGVVGTSMAEGVFHYGGQPQGSVGVVGFNIKVFAVQTSLTYDTPHPGFEKNGAQAFTEEFKAVAIPTPNANVFFAGGRVGAPTVSYFASATGVGASATNNYGNGVPPTTIQSAMDGENGPIVVNGIARFTSTGNQFGGQSIGRAAGTARVYFNGAPAALPDLPCKVVATPLEGTNANPSGVFRPFVTGGPCNFSLSIVDLTGSDATVGIAGGQFNRHAFGTAYTTNTGVFTGTIGFNGTIIGQGNPVTVAGAGIPFTGQGNQAVGMPLTTGRLSITVTLVAGDTSEMFIRSGTDARDAAGNGVVALVTGSMTARDISGGNANRTWVTLEIPEPSAIFAASAGLFALFGCHRLARRRS